MIVLIHRRRVRAITRFDKDTLNSASPTAYVLLCHATIYILVSRVVALYMYCLGFQAIYVIELLLYCAGFRLESYLLVGPVSAHRFFSLDRHLAHFILGER